MPTFVERLAHAERDGYGTYAAAAVHMIHDRPLEDSHYDPFCATLVCGTALFYLYTLRWEWALLGFVLYYFLETAVFLLSRVVHGHVGNLLHSCESRMDELMTDPVVFGLTLWAAHWCFVGSGLVALTADPLGAVFVVPGVLLLMFTRTYWLGVILPVVAAWVYFLASGSSDVAHPLLATGVSLYTGAWFLCVINSHYVFNALYAILFWALFVALLRGVSPGL